MKKIGVIGWIAYLLVVIGAINWGLVGLFHMDLVATLLGPMSSTARAVYLLVGLAGLYMIYGAFKCGKACHGGKHTSGGNQF